MAVYVDNMRAGYGRMIMCHMLADSHEELVAMADKIGVARRWIQQQGTYSEHFDVCLSKRAAAVRAGAIEIGRKDLARMLLAKRSGNCKSPLDAGADRLHCQGTERPQGGSQEVKIHATGVQLPLALPE